MVHLSARLVDGGSGALASLAREMLNSGVTVLSYAVRERDGRSVWADATVELEQPNQLPELLTSLRSLPHVERVSKLSIDRRHKADPPGPERPESQL